ncbi:MAG: flavin-containing monooxygenase, partial [Pseudomonadales bacterium]
MNQRFHHPRWAQLQKTLPQQMQPRTTTAESQRQLGVNRYRKRVIVIGSGAIAATVVPAMTDRVRHITLLQRSPTYFAPGLNRNELADTLRGLDIPAAWTHEIVRRKILHDQQEITRRSFEEPERLKAELIAGARAYLGPDFDVERHFTPRYRPWQQRLAFIPDGDLFRGIASGKASVVTDQIERFTEHGILLKSGVEIEADIIVTATGFDLCVLGGVVFTVDGASVDFAKTVGYRGFMFTGVPNMAWVFGYFRASWTLRADLISDYVCRILEHMRTNHATVVTPRLRAEDRDMEIRPWVDPDNFNPGYLTRSLHLMPKQGSREPWIFTQDYWHEKDA